METAAREALLVRDLLKQAARVMEHDLNEGMAYFRTVSGLGWDRCARIILRAMRRELITGLLPRSKRTPKLRHLYPILARRIIWIRHPGRRYRRAETR